MRGGRGDNPSTITTSYDLYVEVYVDGVDSCIFWYLNPQSSSNSQAVACEKNAS